MTVIGINVSGQWGANDTTENVKAFIEQGGLTFPIVDDTPQSFTKWGTPPDLSPFPLDIVIDKTGVIRYLAHEYNAEQLAAAIDAWK